MADIIIVGAGIGGVVLASRLHERKPELSITLIEAGPNVTSDTPHVANPAEAGSLHFSDLDYKYFTTPQKHLGDAPKYNCAIKGVSGGTVINTGGWIRGDKADYDEWAKEVGDDRWSYDGLLPYFKRSEKHFDPNGDATQHGFDGPVVTASVTSSGRQFPLRTPVLNLWKNLNLPHIPDANNGHPQGIADLVENWNDGKRQLVSETYPLAGITVLPNTPVHRITFDASKTATGVELANGEKLTVKQGGQVVVAAGAYNTPKLLQLSGLGPAATLAQHNIPTVADLPVGTGLFDHLMLFRYWKLRHPELGLALGSPSFGGPNYEKGGPVDWLVTTSIPAAPYKAALEKDAGGAAIPDTHALLQNRSHLEMNLLYAAIGAETQGLNVPLDGSSIMTFCMGCLPTSRGAVMLRSSDPADAPLIDPAYYATEADRHVLREGFRMQTRLMLDTAEGKELVVEEHTPAGHEVAGLDAADELIDKRIALGGSTVFHPGGTAAMGRVVDGGLKVYGVEGLRVVDASVVSACLFVFSLLLWLMWFRRFRSRLRRIRRRPCMLLLSRPLISCSASSPRRASKGRDRPRQKTPSRSGGLCKINMYHEYRRRNDFQDTSPRSYALDFFPVGLFYARLTT